jgi:hypothetical protein
MLHKIVKPLLVVVCVILAIYAAYFLWNFGLLPADKSGSAMRRVGELALRAKYGEESFVRVASGVNDSENDCSFSWTTLHERNCRTLAIAVARKDITRLSMAELIARTELIADSMTRPCSQISLAPLDERGKLSANLGCGTKKYSYRIRVQLREFWLVPLESGGGQYENRVLYTSKLENGEI